ncbi:hypothetical protein [Leptolyngbya iicbica]|uniref:DUF1186 domain-containing protein n=2 Tax=Cyanophyceae TaxID=3028117 RepID=A0A4Q7E6B7_9CYAN|nr:hypothetical protein [Leptolyngbya sp. LK]RZM78007.1 hypothetical protein DYY88_15800 [Leptolyngbya sp. LK]
MTHNYSPPVAQLLSYEAVKPVRLPDWPDYVSEFGFTAEHVPALLELMKDTALAAYDPDNPPPLPDYIDLETAWCAPIHAWRSLYQLRSLDIFGAHTIDLLQSELDEWVGEEFIDMIEAWGPPVIEPVTQLIEANLATENRILPLIEGLYKVPEKFSESRDQVVSILMQLLETYATNQVDNNSFLAIGLLRLKATEAAELLEQAYAAGQIDEFITATWPGAQVELGLKSESDFTEEELTPALPPEMQRMRDMIDVLQRMDKPNAFETGLPVDPSAFPDSRPPGFDDLLAGKKSATPEAKPGFGTPAASKKKKKGKKKKR